MCHKKRTEFENNCGKYVNVRNKKRYVYVRRKGANYGNNKNE